MQKDMYYVMQTTLEYYIDDSDFLHSMAYRDYFWQKLLNM